MSTALGTHRARAGRAAVPSAATPGRVLAVTAAASFMASLDLFIVNVAFPDIARDFHRPSLAGLSWVLNGYAILFAALLVPAGRLADRYGRRRGFLLGLTSFSAASALCAAAPSLPLLVAARALQAAGAAALIPTSLGLLLSAYPAERRQHAVRLWAGAGGLAAAAGPVLGGSLVQASWRWVFLVNVPIGLLGFALAARTLAEHRDPAATRMPDLAGAALLSISIAALTLGLVKGLDWGWLSGRALGSFALAAAGLTLFLAQSARHPVPVVELSLLKHRHFTGANLAALLFTVAFSASLLSGILYMSQVWHYSALRTGLATAPGPLLVLPMTILAGRLISRLGVRWVASLGCVIFATGPFTWTLLVGRSPAYAGHLLPGLLLTGVGVGLALPSIVGAGTHALPPGRFATGSAIVQMSRQIGAVLGVSMLVAILGHPSAARTDAAFHHSWTVAAAVALLAGAACRLAAARPDPASPLAPAG